MLGLDEAIQHCHEKTEELKQKATLADAYNLESEECWECASEHEQLAFWLTELKELRNFAKFITNYVLDDDFEDSSGAFAEIACRKLVKLGYVKLDGDTYKENDK